MKERTSQLAGLLDQCCHFKHVSLKQSRFYHCQTSTAHRWRIKVDIIVATISIKNFPIGLHMMHLYFRETPRRSELRSYFLLEHSDGKIKQCQWCMSDRFWRGKNKVLVKSRPPHCLFAYQKSYINWPGIEPLPPGWKASDKPPEPILRLSQQFAVIWHCTKTAINPDHMLYIKRSFMDKKTGDDFLCDFNHASLLICGNEMPTRCNRGFLLQILLLAQHVSGITMPIIRSSRVLYSGCW